jgi:hypothetical protein
MNNEILIPFIIANTVASFIAAEVFESKFKADKYILFIAFFIAYSAVFYFIS